MLPQVSITVGMKNELSRGAGKVIKDLESIRRTAQSAAAYFGGVRLFDFGKDLVNSAAQLEKTQMLIQGLDRDAVKAGEDFRWMLDFGKDNAAIAGFESLRQGFVRLKATGLDPTNGSLKAIADSVAAFGGTSQDMELAVLAISQMASKGVISMEELRRQLGDRIPGAARVMARELGITDQRLEKLVSSGKLSGDLARYAYVAMLKGLEEDNKGSVERLGTTWIGLMNKLEYLWTVAKGKITEGTFFDTLKEKVAAITTALSTDEGFDAFVSTAVTWLKRIYTVVVDIGIAWASWKAAVLSFNIGTQAANIASNIAKIAALETEAASAAASLGTVLRTTVLGATVIGGIAALTAGFVYLATQESLAEEMARKYAGTRSTANTIISAATGNVEALASAFKDATASEAELMRLDLTKKIEETADDASKVMSALRKDIVDGATDGYGRAFSDGSTQFRNIIKEVTDNGKSATDGMIDFIKSRRAMNAADAAEYKYELNTWQSKLDALVLIEQRTKQLKKAMDVADRKGESPAAPAQTGLQAEFERLKAEYDSVLKGLSDTGDKNAAKHAAALQDSTRKATFSLQNAFRELDAEEADLTGEHTAVWLAKLNDRVEDIKTAIQKASYVRDAKGNMVRLLSDSQVTEALNRVDAYKARESAVISAGFESTVKMMDVFQDLDAKLAAMTGRDEHADDRIKYVEQLNKLMSAGKVTGEYKDNWLNQFDTKNLEERNRKVLSQQSAFYREYINISGDGYEQVAKYLELEAQVYKEVKDAEGKQAIDSVKIEEWAAYQKLQYSREWADGAKKALIDYANEVTNGAKQAASSVSGNLKSLEDVFVSFATKGKANFSDLVTSMIADWARFTTQMAITGPLARAAAGIDWSSLFSVGSSASSNTVANINAGHYATGGNAYAGRPMYVGESGMELFVPSTNGKIFPAPSLMGSGGSAPTLIVNVVEDQSKAGTQNRRTEGNQNILDVFVAQVKSAVAADIVTGNGDVSNALTKTFKLNRALGAY